MDSRVSEQNRSIEMLDAGEARPWPVRILTILLFLESAGLIALSIFSYEPFNLQQEDEVRAILAFFTEIPRTLAFGSLGLLAIVAGLGFLWLWRTAWPSAMLVQGMGLLLALGLYLRNDPPYDYYLFAIMAYCILMVIYLHHPDVQKAFQTKQLLEGRLTESEMDELG